MKDIFSVDLYTHSSKSSSIIERELDKTIIQKQEDYKRIAILKKELRERLSVPAVLFFFSSVKPFVFKYQPLKRSIAQVSSAQLYCVIYSPRNSGFPFSR